jgi:serine-type D-Ala-D-Ala carboxypeptidase (penicillin-binding protein 5/6)
MNETKTKITYIPSGSLAVFAVVFSVVGSLTSHSVVALKSSNATVEPKVLGVYTDVPAKFRGESFQEVSEPTVTGAFATSTIAAHSYLVYDTKSGKELTSKNPADKLPIASITKLMTGLIAYEQLQLDEYTTVPHLSYVKDSPVLNLRWSDDVKAGDVLSAMLIGSENDAAQMLARLVENKTGEKFVTHMNTKAKELGMENSRFSNPLGFYSQYNYSSAEDVRKLVDETQKFPAFQNVGRKVSFTFDSRNGNRYYSTTTNKLIKSHSDIYAIKTGYTKESLGSMVTKVDINGHEVIIIILQSPDREGDTLKLKKQIEDLVDWE